MRWMLIAIAIGSVACAGSPLQPERATNLVCPTGCQANAAYGLSGFPTVGVPTFPPIPPDAPVKDGDKPCGNRRDTPGYGYDWPCR